METKRQFAKWVGALRKITEARSTAKTVSLQSLCHGLRFSAVGFSVGDSLFSDTVSRKVGKQPPNQLIHSRPTTLLLCRQ